MTGIAEVLRQFDDHSGRPLWLATGQQAADFLTQIDTEPLMAALVNRWRDALAADPPLPRLQEVVEESDLALPKDLTDALCQRGGSGMLSRAAQLLVAKAAARTLASLPPDYRTLERIAEVLEGADWTHLPTEFASIIEHRSEWVATLSQLPDRLQLSGDGDENDTIVEEQARWRIERNSPFPDFRGGQTRINDQSGWYLALVLLRALDENRWLQVLDRLPVAAVIETVLWYASIEEDPSYLLSLIASSPAAFDSDGNRTGSVLIYFLTTRAFELGAKVLERAAVKERVASRGAEQEQGRLVLEAVRSEHVPTWYQQIANTLLARADGVDLSIEFAAEYVFRARHTLPHSTPAEERNVQYRSFALIVTKELATHPGILERVQSRWAKRESFARSRAAERGDELLADGLPYWLVGAEAVQTREAVSEPHKVLPAHEVETLWNWLEALLKGRDPSLQRIVVWGPDAIPQWVAGTTGFVLASCTAPEVAWSHAWHQLTDQRAAGRMKTAAAEYWSTSRFLISSGLSALHYLLSRKSSETQRVGETIWRASIAGAITVWLHSGEQVGHDAVLLALAHLAKADFTVSGEPANSISYMVGEPDLAFQAAWALAQNGADLAKVDREFLAAGIDLPSYAELTSLMHPNKGEAPEDAKKFLDQIATGRAALPPDPQPR